MTVESDQQSEQVVKLVSERDELANQIASLTGERDGLLAKLEQAEERLGVGIVELKTARENVADLKIEAEELKISCQRISELEALVQARDANQDETTLQLEQLRSAYNEAASVKACLTSRA